MQDEQFMRQWNADHDRFSADLDRGIGHIVRYFRQRRDGVKSIGSSYGFLDKYAGHAPAKAPRISGHFRYEARRNARLQPGLSQATSSR